MSGPTVPWSEAAILVFSPGQGDRRIEHEGDLRSAVKAIAAIPFARLAAYTIALPDRHVAPFRYEQEDFAGLIRAASI